MAEQGYTLWDARFEIGMALSIGGAFVLTVGAIVLAWHWVHAHGFSLKGGCP